VQAVISSGSLLGTLGKSYLASWVGTLITVGAMISAFSCALASAIGASRLTYALGRDRVIFPWLDHISPSRRTPTLPTGIAWWGASVAAAWLLFGLVGILSPAAIAARAGRRLAASEGLLGPREEPAPAPAEAQPACASFFVEGLNAQLYPEALKTGRI
jgi:hypothetical protein